MVENTNSTTLEVQGSFALTYMVGFIPLKLEKSRNGQGRATRARARRHHRSGRAWRGVAWRGRQAGRRAGVVWLCYFLALTNRVRQPSDPVSSSAE
jgi:hypothetical protein